MSKWFTTNYSVAALWAEWGAVVVGYLVFMLLERLLPGGRHPDFREFATDIRANVVFMVLNPAAVALGAWSAGILVQRFGGPHLHLDLARFQFGELSKFLLAFVPLFIFDFFYYWFHRFQHEWPWLWQVHRLHHTETALNVTANYRHHWLEEFFRAFLILLPMNWLVSLTAVDSAIAAVLIRQWSSFFHANVRIGFGPLSGVIGSPQYHRIHHSIETKHIGRNYAAFFPVWDRIFRTYWRPALGEWPETGLIGEKGIWGFRELVFFPFPAWLGKLSKYRQ